MEGGGGGCFYARGCAVNNGCPPEVCICSKQASKQASCSGAWVGLGSGGGDLALIGRKTELTTFRNHELAREEREKKKRTKRKRRRRVMMTMQSRPRELSCRTHCCPFREVLFMRVRSLPTLSTTHRSKQLHASGIASYSMCSILYILYVWPHPLLWSMYIHPPVNPSRSTKGRMMHVTGRW